jgi:hypothetical protein
VAPSLVVDEETEVSFERPDVSNAVVAGDRQIRLAVAVDDEPTQRLHDMVVCVRWTVGIRST